VDGGMIVAWFIMGLAVVVLLFWIVSLVWAVGIFRKFQQEYPTLKAESDSFWAGRQN